MNSNIQVSVIINSYNYANFIESAINSVLNQSAPRHIFEIIIVDDGSTDDTRQRVSKYLPEVLYHYKENGGQASAINSGLALASGEFVAFLDADDYWHPDKLKEVLTAFESDPSVDVIYHSMCVVDNNNQLTGLTLPSFDPDCSGRPIENDKYNMSLVWSATSGIALRRSVLDHLLPIPEIYKICADGFLMCCVPLVAKKYVLIDKQLAFYRIHGNNGYAKIESDYGAVLPKSIELPAYFRRQYLKDIMMLSARFGLDDLPVIMELKAMCYSDELFIMMKRFGTLMALKYFWTSRKKLEGLPMKYRLFRSITILLKIIVSPSFYLRLQNLYAKNTFSLYLQRHIRRGFRPTLSETHQVVVAENIVNYET